VAPFFFHFYRFFGAKVFSQSFLFRFWMQKFLQNIFPIFFILIFGWKVFSSFFSNFLKFFLSNFFS